MKNDTNEIINNLLYKITNLTNFEKTAKRYFEKYQQLNQYTGIKSISMEHIVLSNTGEKKTYADIILEKNKSYNDYLYFENKIADIHKMLDVLSDIEKEIIIDWYTTPKQYRKKAEDFASDRYMSRTDFFRKKKAALEKLIKYNN